MLVRISVGWFSSVKIGADWCTLVPCGVDQSGWRSKMQSGTGWCGFVQLGSD